MYSIGLNFPLSKVSKMSSDENAWVHGFSVTPQNQLFCVVSSRTTGSSSLLQIGHNSSTVVSATPTRVDAFYPKVDGKK